MEIDEAAYYRIANSELYISAGKRILRECADLIARQNRFERSQRILELVEDLHKQDIIALLGFIEEQPEITFSTGMLSKSERHDMVNQLLLPGRWASAAEHPIASRVQKLIDEILEELREQYKKNSLV